MNTLREKELLYAMLERIATERSDLLQMQFDIMKKLENLDKLELENKNKEHNFVSHDIMPLSTIEEIVRKAQAQQDIHYKQEDSVEEVEEIKDVEETDSLGVNAVKVDDSEEDNKDSETSEENEKRTLKDIIDERNKQMGMQSSTIDNSVKIPIEVIEREKDRLPKRSAYLNLDRVNGLIISVLKESRKPMHIKDVFNSVNDKLDENGENLVKMANLRNNIMPRIVKINKNVSRVTRGFYQYNFQ